MLLIVLYETTQLYDDANSVAELRKATLPIFFDMMLCEFRHNNKHFSNVRYILPTMIYLCREITSGFPRTNGIF